MTTRRLNELTADRSNANLAAIIPDAVTMTSSGKVRAESS